MNGKVKIGRKCAYLGYNTLIIPIDSFTIFMMIIVCLFLTRILLELDYGLTQIVFLLSNAMITWNIEIRLLTLTYFIAMLHITYLNV